MIELPEGLVLAEQLDRELRDKRITDVRANTSPHRFAWYDGDPAAYPIRFTGREIEGAHSYGGKVHLRLKGSGGFLFADGICLRLVPAGGTIPKKHQLYLEFEDGTRLVGSVQMYGALIGYDSLPVSAYDEAARQKPCPLSDDFSPVYFDGLLRSVKPSLSAKAFLATEQRIPGLGNGVLQDILFRAGVHPKRAVSALSSADQDALFGSVKTTLREMAEAGGRNTEKDLYGRPGGLLYPPLPQHRPVPLPTLRRLPCQRSLPGRKHLFLPQLSTVNAILQKVVYSIFYTRCALDGPVLPRICLFPVRRSAFRPAII